MILSDDVLRAAAKLKVDAWTAEAVTALRASGVEPLLLKGPAVEQWLYLDAPSLRGYCDADLLVRYHDFEGAARVLAQLGYRGRTATIDNVLEHAVTYRRQLDGAVVDLHRTIHGLELAAPDAVYEAAEHDAESIVLCGTATRIPAAPFRLLHLTMHVSPLAEAVGQPWEDLRLAIQKIGRTEWEAAAALALSLGAGLMMRDALARAPGAGPAFADKIGLHPARDRRWHLAMPSYYRTRLQRAADVHGTSARVRVVLRMLFPRPPLRTAERETSVARVAAAYCGRYLRLARVAVVSLKDSHTERPPAASSEPGSGLPG